MANLVELGWLVTSLEWIFLVPVVCGSIYAILCLFAVLRFLGSPKFETQASWPAVTILKPVYGLEKNQRENLRSTCLQDYPEFQVVFSVNRTDDPAIPILNEIQEEFGSDLVTVAIEEHCPGTNGKINNMAGGILHARHDLLVISDSDVRLRPDYLKTIVAPLADPNVGCVCTLYKAACAVRWYEKLELLSLNADFMTNAVFAQVTGASNFCLGASTALYRSTLDEIGGFDSLADHLVEDYEMGRRIWEGGRKVSVIPYIVDTMVDLKTASAWWDHQVYWDQNTRAARPGAFFATVLVRSVPFALLYAALRLFDPVGLVVLAAALSIRMITSAVILGRGFRDPEGLRSIAWLPFRDVAALGSWFLAFSKRTTVWRGIRFTLTRDGRLVERETEP